MTSSLTRRELLNAFIGAPLAAAACRRRPRAHAGAIRGPTVRAGHRVLDATVERVSAPSEQVPVIIVGAGPSGLAAAWRLVRQGHVDFRVLDLEVMAGGTSAFGTDGVVPYPWGAHYLPVPRADQTDMIALLDELGVLDRASDGAPRGRETARVRAPEERLFVDGAWHEGLFPNSRAGAVDHAELERFEQLVAHYVRFRDGKGRRAFTLPLRDCSDAAELTALDRLSARDWLRREGYGSSLLAWYLEYACRDDYGASLDRTSAWALLFYFCARVESPGAPSAPFLTWPEGNGKIVDHLARLAGERLRLGQVVTDVVPSADGVDVVAYDSRRAHAVRYRAEHVILAVPKLVVRRILRPYRDAPPAHLGDFHYSAWLVANIHLSDRPQSPGFPFAWDNVLFDSPSLGYVVASHQTLSDFGPTIWTYYRPFSELTERDARSVLFELDHATMADGVLADLARAHRGLEPLVERIDAYRWAHAMIQPEPGFIWGGARAKAAEPFGRVVFAHSDLSGISLFEEAFDQGCSAADRVLARLRLGFG